MMSLSLSVGPWNLSFELGRSEPEEVPEAVRITLGDGTEIGPAVDAGPEALAGLGFTAIVGEAGPELLSPEDLESWGFGPGPHIIRLAR